MNNAPPDTRKQHQEHLKQTLTNCYECEHPVHHDQIVWRGRCRRCCVKRLEWVAENCDCAGTPMDAAVRAGDSVLMNEQAALLRECRSALDDLIKKKPGIEALLCGSTTLGNLRAELGAYRPQGVMGDNR